jgi:hypothetical protein
MLSAVMLALRRAEAFSNPQFWAEDGHFYERACVLGWRSLGVPYAGYLHAIPRIIAVLAAYCDPALVPGIFTACAAALTLYVAARTLSRRCPLPRYAGLCAFAVVLVPDTYEVLLNLINIQWVLAAGFILILISRDPKEKASWVHDLGATLAIGLTGPFCIILWPLFIWRAFRRRTAASTALAAIVTGCALVQACILNEQPSLDLGAPGSPASTGLILHSVGRRVGASLLIGAFMPNHEGTHVGALLGIATLGAVGFLAFRPGPLRGERAILAMAFAGILLASLVRTRFLINEYLIAPHLSRYVFVPQLITIWLLIIAAGQVGRLGNAAALILAWCLAVNIPRLREPAYVDMHWDTYVPKIRAGDAVSVPLNPPGWTMQLPERR